MSRLRRRRRVFAALALVVAAVVLVVAIRDRAATELRTSSGTLERPDVALDTYLAVPEGTDARSPAPAVLVAHGLGQDLRAVRRLTRRLAAEGYVVLAWSARGAGRSTGRVGIAAPDGEVRDVSALVDLLAGRDDVQLDHDGDPRVAVVGTSYGGGTALLASAHDDRIDVVASIFGWHDLERALEPNGVLKLRWASELFASGSAARRSTGPCGLLEPEPCAAWIDAARGGRFGRGARELLDERSPSTVAGSIGAATLLVQGQMDSLFDLRESLDLARILEREQVPVRVEWVRAGHDLPLDERRRDHVEQAVVRWLDRHLAGDGSTDPGPRFSVELGAGRGHAHAPTIPPRGTRRRVELEPVERSSSDGMVSVVIPAAGLPADVSTLPGLGDLTGVDQGFEPPEGQRATFRGSPIGDGVDVVGTPSVRLRFASEQREVLAFVRLVDVGPDGRRIVPRGLVTPLRVTGLGAAGGSRVVDVELPTIAWRLAPGHRFDVVVTSTDAGYVAPTTPGTLAVGVAGDLRLPIVDVTASPDAFDAGRDWRDLLAIAAALLVVAVAAAILLGRHGARRDARVQEPTARGLPLLATDLRKAFDGGTGRVAVDRVSLRVERGTVVGLVGPNGAGKTTTLRMLLGLVRPSDGSAHLFGQLVRPGAPALARVGALVEGPGLAPHLSGREHLERYWSATGRDVAEAGIDEALSAVDLVDDADRVVRTWSHGMRQRLGIAQALLGRPELVVLDEPANGLDPAQIAHLRGIVRGLAAEGRAVLLSSHLLGELELVCSHVVLMAEGRVLHSGTLAEVVDGHAGLEDAFLSLVSSEAADA